ncbi:MAG: hypothetical protein P1S60_03265 [Anaerolineae bacterium]|nr:hypothetical protein [Anaerolineae bacterium]
MAGQPGAGLNVDKVMATGKVVAFALVSIYGSGEGAATSIESGITLLDRALASWAQHGIPRSKSVMS